MSPPPPSSFTLHNALLSTGRTYSYLDLEGSSPEAPVLLLLHGFPDSWYGWSNLFGPLGKGGRGFRLIVPSMMGYHGTDSPEDLSAFTPLSISRNLVSLLDHLQLSKVFLVGHDWGAVVAWRLMCWFPERCRGLCSISIPYSPPSREFLSHEVMASRVPQLGYMCYFDEERATKEIEANLPVFVDSIFQSGVSSVKNSDWTRVGGLRKILLEGGGSDSISPAKEGLLNEEHRAFQVQYLRSSGLDGPLNYYRSHPNRHTEELSMPPPLGFSIPTLHLAPLLDPTSAPVALARAKKFVEGLEVVELPGVGHWVLLEDEPSGWRRVEREVGEWVGRVLEREKTEGRGKGRL